MFLLFGKAFYAVSELVLPNKILFAEHFQQRLLFRFITPAIYFKSRRGKQQVAMFLFSSARLDEWLHEHLGEEDTRHTRLLSAFKVYLWSWQDCCLDLEQQAQTPSDCAEEINLFFCSSVSNSSTLGQFCGYFFSPACTLFPQPMHVHTCSYGNSMMSLWSFSSRTDCHPGEPCSLVLMPQSTKTLVHRARRYSASSQCPPLPTNCFFFQSGF